MIDKLALYGFAALALGGLGWLFNHQIAARVEAETRATQSQLVADLAERERDRMTESLAAESLRAAVLQDELEVARQAEQANTAVLKDRERLTTLTAAKPGLLEIKAQKATTRVWDTIKSESNARPD